MERRILEWRKALRLIKGPARARVRSVARILGVVFGFGFNEFSTASDGKTLSSLSTRKRKLSRFITRMVAWPGYIGTESETGGMIRTGDERASAIGLKQVQQWGQDIQQRSLGWNSLGVFFV
ncbi:uncharacterized protein BJX67DRAFT_225711 [Aspergillus lucknowensis]|uniref:Prion-inhibition and propagation HeLo domain-containing protein n=1 Tax=Aspergillus lucknowensis TaxID=176173 RepID=A0ABR4LIF0_9EURO